ncbi:MAG: hypothetical protein IPM60_16780 [Rhodospirillales bacterium]|nr:hypothetical protein [Rhodospirillales bacterium]
MTLSLRLDPKTKFILDFVSRIKGQNITTVVERAIKETADGTGIGPRFDEFGSEIGQETWSKFWDPSEGVRTLKLIACPYYPTTFDEDELKAFTDAHREFFYVGSRGNEPRRAFVDILWPKIEDYLAIWREKKSTDYWAAGEAMKADLGVARVQAPDWPTKPKLPERPAAPARTPASEPDLEDDIPF